MYSEVFRALKDKANTLDIILSPSLFSCDFERGLISSIRLEFPTASIRGCYFHFCQAVYRRVQTLGLSQLYIHDQESRLYIRKLLAIAFVPIDLIPQTFQNLKYTGPSVSVASRRITPSQRHFVTFVRSCSVLRASKRPLKISF